MVSIIVPVYNAEKYLRKCIESIRSQTLENIQIILVDDGSVDLSGEICDEYAKSDERIGVIHKPNRGLVSARKSGLQLAKGDYIGFVDSDDWIEKDMFSDLYQLALGTGADIVAEGFMEDISGECREKRNQIKAGNYRKEEERAFLYQNMLNCEDYFCMGIQPYLWNKLIRRELAESCMTAVEDSIRVGEDAAVIYPALLAAKNIVISSRCHYHYCIRGTSMIWKKEGEEKEIAGVVKLYRHFKACFSDVSSRYCLEQQLKRYTVNNYLTRAFELWGGESQSLPLSEEIKAEDPVVIYGAGALGRAIYQYGKTEACINVKAWADQNAERYQHIGLPVKIIEKIDINEKDKILIAIFRNRAEQAVRKKLLERGVKENQIVSLLFPKMEDVICRRIEDYEKMVADNRRE